MKDRIAVSTIDMKAKIVIDRDSLAEVLSLLKKNNLPFEDIDLDNSMIVSYHSDNGSLIGSGGLEFYSDVALLRSIAVEHDHRGNAIGTKIVGDLIARAKITSIKEIYLLTETARNFFLNRGFEDVARQNVPVEVQSSTEFQTVCPKTASCMIYRIHP
jgi:amino-acid N-acetyltransferase